MEKLSSILFLLMLYLEVWNGYKVAFISNLFSFLGNFTLYISAALNVDEGKYECQVSRVGDEPALRSNPAQLKVLVRLKLAFIR